ncbi:MAG: DNA-3-methyladenine glycosylase I [Candidatus Promineifilaceae bacterium]
MPDRCGWAAYGGDRLLAYHDTEWGTPLHDDQKLFEFMLLDAFQAGLNWNIILNKRENFRRAFAGFDPAAVAAFDEAKVAELLADAGIIRSRAKVRAAVQNAQAFLKVQQEFGRFDAYIWGFVGGRPVQNAWTALADLPAETDASRAMSKELKRRGFAFVGPTIMYAFMQAAGLVNDHLVGCFRHAQVAALAAGDGG